MSLEINECLEESPCAENATCVDLVIGFNCTCDEGFTGDGLECEGNIRVFLN